MDRARGAKFDAVLGAWNPDLSPAASIASTWTRAGFGGSNWLRYSNPEFERQGGGGGTAGGRDRKRSWRGRGEISVGAGSFKKKKKKKRRDIIVVKRRHKS